MERCYRPLGQRFVLVLMELVELVVAVAAVAIGYWLLFMD
jgi:hypothetical protein